MGVPGTGGKGFSGGGLTPGPTSYTPGPPYIPPVRILVRR